LISAWIVILSLLIFLQKWNIICQYMK
jgi:hypothetical protein